ncbi:MAG: hypothetical protein A2Y25_10355 [Candidatus Melainabacteria bacterium GWF2_37_15]|nr:MAG: hypothetical protein A2Y25_10355 [Candidatus Melainabacteria bacterium GWF2_37_15]
MKQLIAVIPVYNEHEIIDKVLNDWLNIFKNIGIDFEIHIYNDGSTDNTLDKLKDLSKIHPEIIVRNKQNTGHGPTLALAYKENVNNAEWLFQADSDNEISPDYFEKFWNERNQANLLVGKRIYTNKSLIRVFITFIAGVLVKALFGCGINDANVPFRLFKTDKFKEFVLSLPEKTMVPNILMSGYACSGKSKIIEIPVNYTFRQTGTSSIKGLKLLKTAFQSSISVFAYRLKASL